MQEQRNNTNSSNSRSSVFRFVCISVSSNGSASAFADAKSLRLRGDRFRRKEKWISFILKITLKLETYIWCGRFNITTSSTRCRLMTLWRCGSTAVMVTMMMWMRMIATWVILAFVLCVGLAATVIAAINKRECIFKLIDMRVSTQYIIYNWKIRLYVIGQCIPRIPMSSIVPVAMMMIIITVIVVVSISMPISLSVGRMTISVLLIFAWPINFIVRFQICHIDGHVLRARCHSELNTLSENENVPNQSVSTKSNEHRVWGWPLNGTVQFKYV